MQTINNLPKSAQSVQSALEKAGLTCKVLALPSSTRTAIEAANSIGCAISQIVKSLIFKTKETQRPVLVLVSGPNKVNEKKIAYYINEEIIKADAEFTRNITGFAIGGIPPIGHKTAIDLIFIDQDLIKLEEVWAAAGTPNTVFCIKSKDLVTITNASALALLA